MAWAVMNSSWMGTPFTMEETRRDEVRIWIDADACPGEVKDLVFRASRRLEILTTLVANRSMHVPMSSWVRLVQVPPGPDEADLYITEHVGPNDLVITADIPLASAVVEQGAIAINPRGEIYTADNVQERLAVRNLMQELRGSGEIQGGPAQFSVTDRQKFASALDRSLTKLLR